MIYCLYISKEENYKIKYTFFKINFVKLALAVQDFLKGCMTPFTSALLTVPQMTNKQNITIMKHLTMIWISGSQPFLITAH